MWVYCQVNYRINITKKLINTRKRKLEDINTEKTQNPTYTVMSRCVNIIEKRKFYNFSSINSFVLYSIGFFFTKYYHNKCWQVFHH
jgi:hypothetical protein